MLFSGNKEVDRLILNQLDDYDMLKACNTNSYARKTVCDETFFLNRILERFPLSKQYKPSNYSWKKYYLEIIQLKEKMLKQFNFNFTDGNATLYWILLNDEKDIEYVLEKAAENGLQDLVVYFIDLTPEHWENYNWNYALHSALFSKNENLIKYFLEKGEKSLDYPIDNNLGLRVASITNNRKYVDYFLNLGADIKEGIFGAAEANNENLLNYLFTISNSDSFEEKDFKESDGENIKEAILGAIKGNREELSDKLIQQTNLKQWSLQDKNKALINAAYGGNIKYLNLFLQLGANAYTKAFNSAIRGNTENTIPILQIIIKSNPEDENYPEAMYFAMISKNDKIKNFLEKILNE
jgi:hypothetical protein